MAIAPCFRYRWGWRRRGIRPWRSRRRPSRPAKRGARGSAGRSHRWWTSRAMHGGGAFKKAPARTPTSAPRWHALRCGDFGASVGGAATPAATRQVPGLAADPGDAANKAIPAGAGMDMASQTFRNNLAKLVASGKVTVAQIDAAVLPILEIKYRIGLFDHPYVNASEIVTDVSAEGRSLARRLAARSMVLLKNDNHALPLASTSRNVAVIGTLADSPGDITGGPTPAGVFGQGHDAPAVTVLAALKNRVGQGAQITYLPGSAMAEIFSSMFYAFLGDPPLPPPTPAEVADWL